MEAERVLGEYGNNTTDESVMVNINVIEWMWEMMDTAQFASNWKEMNNDANPIDRTIQQSVYRLSGPRTVESFRGMTQSDQWPLPTRVKRTLLNHSDDG